MRKFTKALAVTLSAAMLLPNIALAEYLWAKTAVEYCVENKILSGMENGDLALGDNLTREQMAKIMVDAFGLTASEDFAFSDIYTDRWSYVYIQAFRKYMKKSSTDFNPEEKVTREEFAASLVLASGLKDSNLRNPDILEFNFDDYKKVDSDYKKLLSIAVERGYYKGSEQLLRPKDLLTRAEACSLMYRVLGSAKGLVQLDLGVRASSTPIVGESQISVEDAKAWAEKCGAAQIFIDIADTYWKYGELTGIRPEILYAQAAKETGFGKYGGAVLPEQNNWAGIKTKNATGDLTEDHETFETPDDGVRGHFNHICAYIGLEPIGEPHGRYYSVKSIAWAGSVRMLEELGGKWCPDLYYGYNILHNFMEKM
ncbi:MAG: S-layer homology domain-containing protein [Clostridia bacterium]|nr:S-layer homology domain-containing protein [Clostridia bacterium]